MRTVGSQEAKNKLDALLDLIAGGEEIVITRDGRPAARLVAPGSQELPAKRVKDAVERIRQRRKGVTLDGISIRELIDDGRR